MKSIIKLIILLSTINLHAQCWNNAPVPYNNSWNWRIDNQANYPVYFNPGLSTPSTWADKVFDKSYKLMPLAEVETYVAQNKHLPEIPSEAEVIENGVDVAEMNKLLLQKVEELTLYLIKQEKKMAVLEAKLINLVK